MHDNKSRVLAPDDKRRISVTFTGLLLKGIDSLVKEGFYIDQQAAIRQGMRHLLRFHGIVPFMSHERPEEPR